jgi:hypothetical protein
MTPKLPYGVAYARGGLHLGNVADNGGPNGNTRRILCDAARGGVGP